MNFSTSPRTHFCSANQRNAEIVIVSVHQYAGHNILMFMTGSTAVFVNTSVVSDLAEIQRFQYKYEKNFHFGHSFNLEDDSGP